MPTSEVAIPSPAQEALQFLEHEIKRCLTGSLTAMLGGVPVSAERDKTDAYPSEALWFSGGFTGEAAGSILFALDPAGAVSTGHKLLIAAGLEGESDETAVETLVEVFSQTAGGLASSFVARLKKDVSSQPLVKADIPSSTEHILSYPPVTSDGPTLQLAIIIEPRLVNSLTLHPAELPAKQAALAATLAPATTSGSTTRNLELLLDVELPVSVSFGRAQLQLKDVIKLTTGSIVELNRTVSEPVNIVVNNFA